MSSCGRNGGASWCTIGVVRFRLFPARVIAVLTPPVSEPCANYRGISTRNRKNFRCETNLIEHVLRACLSAEERARLTIIWPYLSRIETAKLSLRNSLIQLLGLKRPTVFVTAENIAPRWNLAPYQIGFDPGVEHPRYLRFPNWQLHLLWPDLPTQPHHNRYGTRLDIERLMTPLNECNDQAEREPRAIMFASHLNEPRRALYKVVSEVLGCDGFGKVFNQDTRRSGGKYVLSKKYTYALCPENSIGPGYITEKIPEAYYAGCVPIAWCRPEDLAIDFNPNAVVNLYGMTDSEQRETLFRLKNDAAFLNALRSEPLLTERPKLEPLIRFLQSAVQLG